MLQIGQTLHQISQGQWVDDRPFEERSPSPTAAGTAMPSLGARNAAKHIRVRERLKERKEVIIRELVATCPSYKPPAGWRPPQKTRKLYLPTQDPPGRNFVGLLIGPRGRTQQELEQRTGAKIAIRCVQA
jgi:splicing factor 1